MALFVNADYHIAAYHARECATKYKRDMGIEAAREFGKKVYRVHMLPAEDKRFGWELRCEVIHPNEPLGEKP